MGRTDFPLDAAHVTKELKLHGYSVVRQFLSESDVSADLANFLFHAPKYVDGVINRIPSAEISGIESKIKQLMPSIANGLGLKISSSKFGYSAIRINKSVSLPTLRSKFDYHRDPKLLSGGMLNWHLDHFSYYLYQDHTNWLICYMPIVKPFSHLSNLAIIPYDVLKSIDPITAKRVSGRGALRFRMVEPDTINWFKARFADDHLEAGDWFAIDDFDDATSGWRLTIDLEKYKVVPQLNAYDLLIMRADVIHRSDDAGSDRISIRCDGIPVNARNFERTSDLLLLTMEFPFMGAKRRYNIKSFLKSHWSKRLAEIKN